MILQKLKQLQEMSDGYYDLNVNIIILNIFILTDFGKPPLVLQSSQSCNELSSKKKYLFLIHLNDSRVLN